MRAVTFEEPGRVQVSERPEPELTAGDEAIVRVQASGICGSDLHIYHGRVKIEPGFTIGHEFVGEVVAAGDQVTRVKPGDRVLGCYHSACGSCFFCLRGIYHKCDHMRTFGHGALLGSLPGTQADYTLVPSANLTLRRVPDGLSDQVALFAGDVLGTGLHAVQQAELGPGDTRRRSSVWVRWGCAPCRWHWRRVPRPCLRSTASRRAWRWPGASARYQWIYGESPRDVIRRATGHGVDAAIDAVGHPAALDLAIRLARKAGIVVAIGVYAEPAEVHMGLVWIKALTLRSGHANVIGHVDRVLAMLAAGTVDPTPLVTHELPLDDAPAAYAIYDRREALKIVLRP